MAFLNAQRAKLAAMNDAAEVAAAQGLHAEGLSRKMAALDEAFEQALNAPVVTELTSSEMDQQATRNTSPVQICSSAQETTLVLCTVCFDCPCACATTR